jgi:acetate kinase
VIVAHLGSGASLCAMKQGKSMDSSLGFTALDGLCMGTRPGTVDPACVLYLFQTLKLSAKEVETILYKKSGLLGLSGISNDMRDSDREPRSRAVLGRGLLRLSAPPKRSARSRRRSRASTAWSSPPASARTPPKSGGESARPPPGSGIDLDQDANHRHGPRISRAGSRVSAWVIPTNEELMIARHTGTPVAADGRASADGYA